MRAGACQITDRSYLELRLRVVMNKRSAKDERQRLYPANLHLRAEISLLLGCSFRGGDAVAKG